MAPQFPLAEPALIADINPKDPMAGMTPTL
jgi:hypothetical protein